MAKRIELRRHTDNEGDVLTPGGLRAAVDIGGDLVGPYDLLVSSGAQRATQTAACLLAGFEGRVEGGVVVDEGFRSPEEDRWKTIYSQTGSGEVRSFLDAAPDFVEEEAERFAEAARRVADHVPDGGRALVVGHSPMQEATVYGLTGETIQPLGKGEGVVVVVTDEGFEIEHL